MPEFAPTAEYVNETHGPAHVTTTVQALTALYGEPNSTDDEYKVDVAWDLRGPAGAVHVYNYKNGPNYLGEGTLDDIDSVSVQGTSKAAVDAVVAEIEAAS